MTNLFNEQHWHVGESREQVMHVMNGCGSPCANASTD